MTENKLRSLYHFQVSAKLHEQQLFSRTIHFHGHCCQIFPLTNCKVTKYSPIFLLAIDSTDRCRSKNFKIRGGHPTCAVLVFHD